jgi:hypothetical protein
MLDGGSGTCTADVVCSKPATAAAAPLEACRRKECAAVAERAGTMWYDPAARSGAVIFVRLVGLVVWWGSWSWGVDRLSFVKHEVVAGSNFPRHAATMGVRSDHVC